MTYNKSGRINCEIKIKERLEKCWAEWFEGLNFIYKGDGTTTLAGSLPDQAALHSILSLSDKEKIGKVLWKKLMH
ncbi:MAG: hypothetical protein JSV61_08460 [Anaerolineales bacterium]|nr:MAG: hypothetical protein JSV61_08460 [Anaerolineales bacterium]